MDDNYTPINEEQPENNNEECTAFQLVETEGPNESPEPETEETERTPERPAKKKRKGLIALLIALMLILSCCLGYAGAAIYDSTHNGSGGNNVSKTDGYTLEDATGSDQTVSEVAEANADAVVEIVTESVATDSWYGQYITEGAGSGVIISSDGYIMTNNHVVDGARSVKVTMSPCSKSMRMI